MMKSQISTWSFYVFGVAVGELKLFKRSDFTAVSLTVSAA